MRFVIRFHQLLFILAILSSCYAPDVKDCTVTCEGPDDCADGQSCTMGLCAATGTTCMGGSNMEMPDAPIAPAMVMLHVQVMGNGRVDIVGSSTCQSDCMVMVPQGSVTLTARPNDLTKPFDKWTSMACMNQPAMCTLSVVTPTTVAAKFH